MCNKCNYYHLKPLGARIIYARFLAGKQPSRLLAWTEKGHHAKSCGKSGKELITPICSIIQTFCEIIFLLFIQSLHPSLPRSFPSLPPSTHSLLICPSHFQIRNVACTHQYSFHWSSSKMSSGMGSIRTRSDTCLRTERTNKTHK